MTLSACAQWSADSAGVVNWAFLPSKSASATAQSAEHPPQTYTGTPLSATSRSTSPTFAQPPGCTHRRPPSSSGTRPLPCGRPRPHDPTPALPWHPGTAKPHASDRPSRRFPQTAVSPRLSPPGVARCNPWRSLSAGPDRIVKSRATPSIRMSRNSRAGRCMPRRSVSPRNRRVRLPDRPSPAGIIHTFSTPTAPRPVSSRKTIEPFSALSNTDAPVTSRRMSRPDAGPSARTIVWRRARRAPAAGASLSHRIRRPTCATSRTGRARPHRWPRPPRGRSHRISVPRRGRSRNAARRPWDRGVTQVAADVNSGSPEPGTAMRTMTWTGGSRCLVA